MFMDVISLLLLAFALAADAFSVAVTAGMTQKKIKRSSALEMGLCFGIFQFVMPYMGAFLGTYLEMFVKAYSDFLAFFLLCLVGGKMIYDCVYGQVEEQKDPFGARTLLLLGFATSIDAFAAGISLVAIADDFLMCAAVIGIVAFACSYAGIYIGRKAGRLAGERAGLFGGIILILIGLKILITHFL